MYNILSPLDASIKAQTLSLVGFSEGTEVYCILCKTCCR